MNCDYISEQINWMPALGCLCVFVLYAVALEWNRKKNGHLLIVRCDLWPKFTVACWCVCLAHAKRCPCTRPNGVLECQKCIYSGLCRHKRGAGALPPLGEWAAAAAAAAMACPSCGVCITHTHTRLGCDGQSHIDGIVQCHHIQPELAIHYICRYARHQNNRKCGVFRFGTMWNGKKYPQMAWKWMFFIGPTKNWIRSRIFPSVYSIFGVAWLTAQICPGWLFVWRRYGSQMRYKTIRIHTCD